MSAFKQPLDILNRALIHLGLPLLIATTDNSKNAVTVGALYDKIREYELRRNLWRFATRRVALRPAASTTVLLTPPLWTAGSYPGGSIVADSSGQSWVSLVNKNTGTPGQPGSGWEEYFGPLTITPWNNPNPVSPFSTNPFLVAPGVQPGSLSGSTSYFPGELVYLPDGKGGVTLFQALMPSFPPANPDGPNQLDIWQAGITYSKGQIAFLYSNANGEFILGVPTGLGVNGLTSNAFQSTIDFNTGNQPDLCETNAAEAMPWVVGHTYNIGETVAGSDTQLYTSKVGSNVGVNPVFDTLFTNWTPLDMWAGTWTTAISPTPRAISNSWQYIPGATASMVIPYPLTSGPLDHTASSNAYRLPAGFLREAPEDPTQGGTPWLGAPTYNTHQSDFTYEGDFIVTRNNQPIIYRFVANTTDVSRMDPMFCEGLAAAIAVAAAPTLAPAMAGPANIAYKQSMFEARTVNAIEIGAVKPPSDDYLNVRI